MKYALPNKYPIETKDQLEKTANYFDKYLTRFHPADRLRAATAIEKRANDLNVPLDMGWVKNYARAIVGDHISPDFSRNMDMRKHACANKEITIAGKAFKANDLIDSIKSNIDKEAAFDMVDAIFEFDKRAGLEYQWDKSILDPIMTVFGSLHNPNFDKTAALVPGSLEEQLLRYGQRMIRHDLVKHPIKTMEEVSEKGDAMLTHNQTDNPDVPEVAQ